MPSLQCIAAEPASILYMITGVVGLAFAGIRRTSNRSGESSTAMLFCRRTSHNLLKSLELF